MRRVPSKHRNRVPPRRKEQGALGRLGLLLFCGLVLASGFVYAGVQHFGALRLGYETEKLRNDLDKAREERKRLLSAREAAASPIRLEQAARQLGMQPIMPAQIDPLRQRTETEATKPAPTSQMVETRRTKEVASAPGRAALKPAKAASPADAMPSASVKATVSVKSPPSSKPTSLKIQQKPNNKASSDQKKSR
jgi:hypothetical protein